jgi:hypothetical protein
VSFCRPVANCDRFKPDTTPGISGWTHHLLGVALRSPVVLKALHTLTGLIAAGTAPAQSMLCSSRLTALLKPDEGYRPIAVGELVYWLCTKAILRHSLRPDVPSSLPVWGRNQRRGRTSDSGISEGCRLLPRPTSATHLTPWTEGTLAQDCASSLPVSTEQADGPTAHLQTSFWPAGRRGPPTASCQLNECARVTLSVP